MLGLGYRRDMADWDMSAIEADFFEVVPENWVRRDRAPLHQLIAGGRPVHLHGVSLNLGGTSALDRVFLKDISDLIDDLGARHYSDHLAASGDAHQLHDLFPIPFTVDEVRRVGDRIRAVQDVLGRRIAVENSTWYTNIGTMSEADFLAAVAEHADCQILLDLNNITVNQKNHGTDGLDDFIARIDLRRVTYMHVAGHEFDERFDLYIDTHSQPVEPPTAAMARRLQSEHGLPILLEWDNDLPELLTLNQELACLRPRFTTT
ncbi:DUF692 domain-containing protein [Aquabacterium sp. A3]|uniref:DUF692 domain-containing protein n=1 Tax=Aquabacterium sp. A3 TaxID=3132829 RepID=UPI003119819A